MSETQTPAATPNVKEAAEILGGKNSRGGDDLRRLERALAREREDELARKIRLLRVDSDVRQANEILNREGGEDAAELLGLAKRLGEYKYIGLARRILKRARVGLKRSQYPSVYLEIFQRSALYTYKDPDLPLEWRLDHAYDILREVEDLAATGNHETLGLAGAIYKRKWEVDGQRHHLERALFFHLRGYAQAAPEAARADVSAYLAAEPGCTLSAADEGYNGINAAFLLDQLAQLEEAEAERAGLVSVAARQRREFAAFIRAEIIRAVPPLLERPGSEWLAGEWWFYATVGEAHFGLGSADEGHYDKAVEWLVERPREAGLKVGLNTKSPSGLEVPEWEFESTARQLAQLARLHAKPSLGDEEFEQTPAGRALKKFLRDDEKAVRSTFRGKFGLGLSGGGFRASLFHIGVLARLAELDVLRHVEVLSCVSGGSIIGAHYYLEVRKLLETKTDNEIGREDYVEIVKRVERDFLAGVQRNIRTRVLAEWATNLKMIFSSGYTRTLRVGELYERELFSKVEDVRDGDGDGRGDRFRSPVTGPKWVPDWLARRMGWRREERWLNDLYIRPKTEDGTPSADFNPRSQNWRRSNKAPILVLNAASLNTGHNWQFTASFMGEPPAPINKDIDCNYRLRRLYYKDAPDEYKRFRLGYAVAASSCVPGLFEPLVLDGLYPDDDGGGLRDGQPISVRLVDGGATDNQGVASLLEQECTVLLVSDASGQMEAENRPGGGPLGVLLRTTSMVQARVREAQYEDISARRRSSLLRGLMFIHLRQDLPGGDIAWRNCPAGMKASDFESGLDGRGDATSFDVSADVQRKLAAIRTDLDSFTDAEAFALMASAYRMTKRQFEGPTKCVEGFPAPRREEPWRFLAEEVTEAMRPASVNPDAAGRRHLERMLAAGSNVPFKIWKLSRPLIVLKYALAAALLASVVWLFVTRWGQPIVPPALTAGLTFEWVVKRLLVPAVVAAALAVLLNALFGGKRGKYVLRLVRWRSTLRDIAVGVVGSTLGFVAARIHLHLFDKLFLRYGRLDNFPKGK